MERRYTRTHFLRDAQSLGLSAHLASSRTALRRQRDCLIREHHPDRGGSTEKARDINDTYARMVKWLEARNKPNMHVVAAPADAPQPEATPSSRFFRKAATITFWAVALIASRYVIARKNRG